MGLLTDIANADGIELIEAAQALVENGVQLSAQDWLYLGTEERAALTVARRAAKVAQLAERGDDLGAAAAAAVLDDGVSHARLMAEAAMRGALAALRQQREGAGG